jgi:SAM-dependent methyltransferase
MIDYLPSKPGKLLDIGCGRGDFIHETRTRGWAAEGVDLIDWGNPHGLKIHLGDFSEMQLPQGTYDVTTAWSSLEHVRKPSLFFLQSSLLLKPGGFFIFIVPNFMAPGMRYCCTQDVPRHLWLFSPIAIHLYAEKFGFIVSNIYHDDSIYTCYPFGMVRYGLSRTKSRKCHDYENRSVAMLQHLSFRDNYSNWIKDVLKTLPLKDIFIDAIDLGIGVVLAKLSKYLRNYGMITVVLRKT